MSQLGCLQVWPESKRKWAAPHFVAPGIVKSEAANFRLEVAQYLPVSVIARAQNGLISDTTAGSLNQ